MKEGPINDQGTFDNNSNIIFIKVQTDLKDLHIHYVDGILTTILSDGSVLLSKRVMRIRQLSDIMAKASFRPETSGFTYSQYCTSLLILGHY